MNQPRARMLQRFSLGGLGLAGVSAALLGLFGAGCGGGQIAGGGQSTARTEEGLSGCHGKASSAIPSSGDYYLTSFGFSPSDNGEMSCGSYTQGGNWYYAASRQRYGCGAHIRIEGNGKCVVAQTDDYGPDVCVESAAGRPIIDASPLVSEHLFGVKSAGYSDHFAIEVTEVARTTPLGPCDAGSGSGSGSDPGSGSGSGSGTGTAPSNPAPPAPPPPSSGPSAPAGCHSATLDADVGDGTCVQSGSDGTWYTCQDGSWYAGQSGCTSSYAWCHSDTLNEDVPPRTCVQSTFDDTWYQCTAGGWAAPVQDGAGPLGTCAAEYSL